MPEDDTTGERSDANAGPDHELAALRVRVIRAGFDGDADVAAAARTHAAPVIREAAVGALARLGRLDAHAVLDALLDPAPRVVHRAIELSARHGRDDARVDDALLARLRGDDHGLAEVAAWALGERHEDDEVRPAPPSELLDALTAAATAHDDALVREAATAALGSIGDPSTVWAVLAACRDKATVRRRAVLALAAFEGPAVDEALRTAREDRDWQVRQAAEDLLAP